MPKNVQVPGFGVVEFPDDMKDEDIANTIRTQILKPRMEQGRQPAHPAQQSTPGQPDMPPLPPQALSMTPEPPPEPGVLATNLRRVLSPSLEDLKGIVLGPFATGENPLAPPQDPLREPPTGRQAAAELTGGIAGSMIGTPFGPVGKSVGAAIGTGTAGYATGRSAKDAIFDAVESGIGEFIGGKVASGLRQTFIPSMGDEGLKAMGSAAARPSARQAVQQAKDILRGKYRPTNLQVGQDVQAAMSSNQQALDQAVKAAFAPVKAGAKPVDMSAADELASKLGVSIREVGADVQRGTATVTTPGAPPVTPYRMAPTGQVPYTGQVSAAKPNPPVTEKIPYAMADFDDAMRVKSQVGSQAAMAAASGDRQKSAALWQVYREVDSSMAKAAKAGGVMAEWDAANQFYKSEYVPRFLTEAFRKTMDMSGERIIDKLRTADFNDIRDTLKSMTDLNGQAPGVMQDLRGAIVADIIKGATEPGTGIVRPRALLSSLRNFRTPEAPQALLGPDLYKAMNEFGETLLTANKRVTLGIGTTGAAVLGAGIGAATSPAAMVGAIEAGNELNMFGRMIAGNPKIAKAITNAVLTGKDEAVRKLGLGNILRIGVTQGAVQGGLQSPYNLREGLYGGAEAGAPRGQNFGVSATRG